MNDRLPLLLAVLMAALAAGCTTEPVQDQPPTDTTTPETPPPKTPVQTTGIGFQRLPPEFDDPASPLYQRVIYFDYDSSEIPPRFIPILRAHGLYLSTHARARIRLEGHADERGTREYNLALSEQRAQGVRRFLLAEGVSAEQISVLSYGEERPAQPGHDEESWTLNRRVELIY